MKIINKIIRNNNGLTLIELIAALVILGVILSPILYLYFNSQTEATAERRTINAQKQINDSLQLILDNLRMVGSKKVAGGNSVDIENPKKIIIRYENSHGILQQIVYAQISDKLYEYKNTSGTFVNLSSVSVAMIQSGRVIADDVTGFNFVDNINYFDIKISVDPPNSGTKRTREISLSTKFTPRYNDIR